MGNLLLQRGFDVRIVFPKPRALTRTTLRRGLLKLLGRREQLQREGWLHEFRGRIETFNSLAELHFEAREIVIAVGTFTVHWLLGLERPVLKVRFNHGFPQELTARAVEAWSLPMPTITVSRTLVPRLEEMSGCRVLAVVPNGIDPAQYFVVPGVPRNGIGTIYSSHPNKAPEDIIRVMQSAHAQWPKMPQIIFSTEPSPRGLGHCHYERYPSLRRIRELYNQTRAWLLMSRTEGLPGPVLEAMACGCPVITSDNDGSLEVVRHRENGLVVPRGDISQFLDAIALLLAEKGLVQTLVEGGLATVRRYSWENAANTMEEFLRGYAAGGSTNPVHGDAGNVRLCMKRPVA
jgi:glycosyltransferase involved in cell wall biosynthesis